MQIMYFLTLYACVWCLLCVSLNTMVDLDNFRIQLHDASCISISLFYYEVVVVCCVKWLHLMFNYIIVIWTVVICYMEKHTCVVDFITCFLYRFLLVVGRCFYPVSLDIEVNKFIDIYVGLGAFIFSSKTSCICNWSISNHWGGSNFITSTYNLASWLISSLWGLKCFFIMFMEYSRANSRFGDFVCCRNW